MRWLTDLWFRMRALLAREALERELREEFAFHLEMETEKHVARGLTPAEARRAARVKFGGEEMFKEQARESWGVTWFDELGGDLRHATRQLGKHPGFSGVAILTLALGIAGTVALLSVVYGLMIRPLPVPDEERLVVFWSDYSWRGVEFDLIKPIARSYDDLAAFSINAYTLREEAGSSLILSTVGSAELFDVLSVAPLLGRTFQAGDDRPDAEPVIILGHGLWQRAFGADPGASGRALGVERLPLHRLGPGTGVQAVQEDREVDSLSRGRRKPVALVPCPARRPGHLLARFIVRAEEVLGGYSPLGSHIGAGEIQNPGEAHVNDRQEAWQQVSDGNPCQLRPSPKLAESGVCV